jgi:Holliday junction resolvase RusA-like endonuclease
MVRWSEDDLSAFRRRRERRSAAGCKPAAFALPKQPGITVITLPGNPRGKGRPRHRIIVPKPGSASWSKGTRAPFTITYTDEETEAYEKALKAEARTVMGDLPPFEGPLLVAVTAGFAVPASWPQKKRDAALAGTVHPTGKPDWDNVAKMTDALNEVVWKDDSQVVRGTLVKKYAEQPFLRVEIQTFNEGTLF